MKDVGRGVDIGAQLSIYREGSRGTGEHSSSQAERDQGLSWSLPRGHVRGGRHAVGVIGEDTASSGCDMVLAVAVGEQLAGAVETKAGSGLFLPLLSELGLPCPCLPAAMEGKSGRRGRQHAGSSSESVLEHANLPLCVHAYLMRSIVSWEGGKVG